jgi:3'-phosphoadenosine 5'-phosphosulfate sulfotransferase (PAPS reductase)/FAD synthetase
MVRQRQIGKVNSKSQNDAWHEAYQHIHRVIPKEHIDQLVNKTVRQIKRLTRNRVAALSWSGGKDSLLIEKLCEMAGTVHRGVWVTAKPLEFPAFYEWCMKNKPPYVEVLDRGFDYQWLKDNPKMFFPPDDKNLGKIKTKWDDVFQRKGQEIFFKNNPDIEIKVTGRRRQDGNFCGNGTNYYTRKDGQICFNPVADWTHFEMLAFFKYYDVQLPPIYTKAFPHGWTIGTILWANLLLDTDEVNTWRYIYSIDPSIVHTAASHFESAAEMLETPEIPFIQTIDLYK